MLQGIFVMGGVTNLLSQEIGEIKMRNKFSVTIERVAWLARLKFNEKITKSGKKYFTLSYKYFFLKVGGI